MEEKFTIVWETTTVDRHRATVDAATVASMLGVTEAEVLAAGPGGLDGLGNRGLENGLADIEEAEGESYELNREVVSVTAV